MYKDTFKFSKQRQHKLLSPYDSFMTPKKLKTNNYALCNMTISIIVPKRPTSCRLGSAGKIKKGKNVVTPTPCFA